MPAIQLNEAVAPCPSEYPQTFPAIVETNPVAMTALRMVQLSESAIYRLVPSVVIASGWLNRAEAPVPSVESQIWVPARVVTALVAIAIIRILSEPASVIYRVSPEIVMPVGPSSFAVVPKPSDDPKLLVVPAKVVTSPVLMTIFRINWLP